MTPPWALVIAAGGSGSRFGGNKLLLPLGGRPVVCHALSRLGPSADAVVLAVPASDLPTWRALTATLPFPVRLVAGGAFRAESVRNALAVLPERIELVAIHDAARPFASRALLQRLLACAEVSGAAIPAHHVTDTVKRVRGGCVDATIDRDTLAAVETPQVFRLSVLNEALARAAAADGEFTDDAAVLEYAGFPVSVCFHDDPNPKITYPADLQWAEYLLSTAQVAPDDL